MSKETFIKFISTSSFSVTKKTSFGWFFKTCWIFRPFQLLWQISCLHYVATRLLICNANSQINSLAFAMGYWMRFYIKYFFAIFFYWGALLVYPISSNHFLMACKSELYSSHLEVVEFLFFLGFVITWAWGKDFSIQLLWATAWLLVTHISLIYLVDEFFLLWCYWSKRECWVKVFDLNQENDGGSWVQDFLVLPKGFNNFPSVLSQLRWHM